MDATCYKFTPPGYLPCTREQGHNGPCAHPISNEAANMLGKPWTSALKHIHDNFPALSELELSIALNTCKEAGAANAAHALGKYIIRLQCELELLRKQLP